MAQRKNPLAKYLRSPVWHQRVVQPKKGKGSFKRKPKHPQRKEDQ